MAPSTVNRKAAKASALRNIASPKLKTERKVPPKEPLSTSILFKVARRMVITVSVMLIIYMYNFYQEQQRLNQGRTMASVKENIINSPLGQEKACAPQYRQDVALFPKCAPSKCGRFVSDSIVSEREALELRILAETVFSISQPSGGVAIFDLNSGALSNGTQFVNLFQLMKMKNSNLITQKSLDTFCTVKNKLLQAVSIHFGASPEQLHLTSPVFFTRITNAKARTLNDEYWHPHIDKAVYGTFVYTTLLYLNSFEEEFTGGRFIYLDTSPQQNVTVEPKFGRVSAFTSASENTHMVEPVRSGARLALTIPFSCDPKFAIKDPSTSHH